LNGIVALGLLLTAAGGASVYLASPNQRWRHNHWPARPARAAGALLLAAGLLVLLQVLRPAAGSFVFVHWLMLLFVLFPYLGALRGTCRESGS
jgi:uncharacterized membrane protein HdeD (DUF308 family)